MTRVAAPPPRSIRLSPHSLPRFPARALFLRALTLSLGTHNTHQTALSFCRSLALARLRARALTRSLSLSLSLSTHRHTQNALHTHTQTQTHTHIHTHTQKHTITLARTCTRVRARRAGGARGRACQHKPRTRVVSKSKHAAHSSRRATQERQQRSHGHPPP